MFSFDPSEEIDALTRKTVFDQYAEKVVYYQRFVKPSISEEMAKGILELCAAMIYNDNPSDEEMDEFAEKVADKVTMFVIQMKNALRGLSAPAAWQTPEKFFI